MSRLRFLDAGESHGPALTVILEGLPAGLRVDSQALNAELARRQEGFGSGGRMRIEHDQAEVSSGVMAGLTTGAPITLRVLNKDWENWKDRDIDPMSVPRPGHADLVGALKYGHADLRLSLERASARETATRVCVGALCKQLLACFGIQLGGYVTRIGQASADLESSAHAKQLLERAAGALANDVHAPTEEIADTMRQEILSAKRAKDSLGGVLEVFALGLPVGLGSHVHWDRRLDGRLAQALMSIQAMKGVEIGEAFENASRRGSQAQDEILRDEDGALRRASNRAGGLEGGISNGEPLLARLAMKPISTTPDPRRSVNLATGEPAETVYERSDTCAVPRAVPIAEAMMAFVLADALSEKLGGDSLDEMHARFKALPRPRVEDFHLNNKPWRFLEEAPSDD